MKCPKCNTWIDNEDYKANGCWQCQEYERRDKGLCYVCGIELPYKHNDDMCPECRRQYYADKYYEEEKELR